MQLKKGQRGAMAGQAVTPTEGQEQIRCFEEEIRLQEDILYGAALFYECLCALVHEQDPEAESRQVLFQDIIQTGRAQIDRALALLEQVRKNPEQAGLLEEFVFKPCEGYPNPSELTKQARILVRIYEESFPGRPREQAFTENEILKLVESAADKVA